jgi:hypothetical protein
MRTAMRVRDPQTGRTLIVYEEPQYPPVPYDEPCDPPVVYEHPSCQFQQRQRGNPVWSRPRRKRRGATWAIGVAWFVTAFCACEISPVITLVGWGLLLSWLLWRAFTAD